LNNTSAYYTALGNFKGEFPLNSTSILDGKKYNFNFYHTFLWNGIYQDFFMFSYKKENNAFGISLNYLNYGTIDRTDTFGFYSGTFSAYDFSINLGFAHRFSNFNFGINTGLANERIDSISSTSYLINSSLSTRFKNTNFIFSIINLGKSVKFVNESFTLPWGMFLGINYYYKSFSFLSSFEMISGYSPKFSLAFSYLINRVLDLRAGYQFNYGFTMGIGVLNVKNFYFDYSVNYRGLLGFTNHIGIAYRY
jgi:hypothetical protein